MQPILEKFFAEHEEKLRNQREELLHSLNLEEETGERKPISSSQKDTLKKDEYVTEMRDGIPYYYRIVKRPIDVSDDEFARIYALLGEEAKLKALADAPAKPSKAPHPAKQFSWADSAPAQPQSGWIPFFKVMAVLIWLGGLILAIYMGSSVGTLMTLGMQDSFHFGTFLAVAVTAALGGCFCMAAGWALGKLEAIDLRVASIERIARGRQG